MKCSEPFLPRISTLSSWNVRQRTNQKCSDKRIIADVTSASTQEPAYHHHSDNNKWIENNSCVNTRDVLEEIAQISQIVIEFLTRIFLLANEKINIVKSSERTFNCCRWQKLSQTCEWRALSVVNPIATADRVCQSSIRSFFLNAGGLFDKHSIKQQRSRLDKRVIWFVGGTYL